MARCGITAPLGTPVLPLVKKTAAGSVPLIPAGVYNLVCVTPNYPPVVQSIALAAGESKTFNIDFDKLAGTGGTIAGKVADSNGNPLPGATVSVTGLEPRTFQKTCNSSPVL